MTHRHMTRRFGRQDKLALRSPVARAIVLRRMRAAIRDLGVAIYLLPDGERDPDMLAAIAWGIGVGAEIAANVMPGSSTAKRLHAALRTVVALSESGGHWQSSQAGPLLDAMEQAQQLLVAHPHVGQSVMGCADHLAERIRHGTARLSDVAGAELYAQPAGQQPELLGCEGSANG